MRRLLLAALTAATLSLSQLASASLMQSFITDPGGEDIGFIKFTTLTPASVADVAAFELNESGLMIGLSDLFSAQGTIDPVTGVFTEGEIGFNSPVPGSNWTRTYFFQTNLAGEIVKSALTIIPGCPPELPDCNASRPPVKFFDLIASESPASVPLPATLALLCLGLAGLGYSRRR